MQRLLYKEIENYGILKITEEGRHFLKKSFTILVPEDHDYENDYENMDATLISGSDGEGVDKVLLDRKSVV